MSSDDYFGEDSQYECNSEHIKEVLDHQPALGMYAGQKDHFII